MNASPAMMSMREQAHHALAEALRRAADAVEALAIESAGPRLVATGREPEILLTPGEAANLLQCSRRHIERLVTGKACRRRAGRRVLIERAGLLALLRRG